ncbi:hypothetical protein LKL35_26320 [Streptomyces sp. ET3-23]|uniref:hypothetical protein n=1 Tax=Streptomyces sp. ET3-23 TaxID=2885643 RepID=UPI001D0FCE4E|nr:hypothetical protein [Streptomyces sp. ET3-23]MCC2278916.1 hypothetical protein [Streptomyces sp. ET3-23]
MSYDAKCEFPEGELYVTIIAARTKSEIWGGESVLLPEPRLAISSSLDEKDAPGFVKIRGRKYRVASRRTRAHARREEYLRSAACSVWSWESPLRRREFTNENDQEIGEPTAARRRLRQMVEDAATRFEADHPDWRLISERLELEGELGAAEVAVATVRDELRKAEARVTDLTARIATYTA